MKSLVRDIGYFNRILLIIGLIKSRFSRASVYSWGTLSAVILSTNGSVDLHIILLSVYSTFSLSLAVYLTNDLVDLEVDRINAPDRPLVSQSIRRFDILIILFVLNFSGVSVGYILYFESFLITIGEVILGILYSAKPFNFKNRFLIKTLSIGLGGFLAIVFGGFSAGNLNGRVIYSGVIFFLFLFVTSPINDLKDYVGDKAQNRRTIPIVIGRKKTVVISLIASFTPLASNLFLYSSLGFNLLSIAIFYIIAIRSVKLIIPLLKESLSLEAVKSIHKSLVPSHFILQGALMIGLI